MVSMIFLNCTIRNQNLLNKEETINLANSSEKHNKYKKTSS